MPITTLLLAASTERVVPSALKPLTAVEVMAKGFEAQAKVVASVSDPPSLMFGSSAVPPCVKPLLEATELTLLLKVVQSVADNTPLFADVAASTFSVITGVAVPVATVLLIFVPVVPIVKAETLVTVPIVGVVQLAKPETS